MDFETAKRIFAGTLSDEHIIEASNKKKLIASGFDQAQVHQACYELRAGQIYFELDTVDPTTTAKRHDISANEYILVKPKQLVTVITHESLHLPPNVLGRILTKGKLFSIGIIPVNTYADPGFRGNIGIILANFSHNYIKIKPGDSIAKIEFSLLQHPVASPYHGQHGFQTGTWPVSHEMLLTEEEQAADSRIGGRVEELRLSFGRPLATAYERIEKHGHWLMVTTAAYITFSMVVVGYSLYAGNKGSELLDPLLAVGLGLLSNVLFAIVSFLLARLWR